MDFRVERYEEVSSTNDLIKSRIEAGENEGLAISADSQNGGYGRRGNAWASPKGGLYISLLLRPKADVANLPTLSHICAIAVRRTIAGFLEPDKESCVKIKWPNDVVYMDDANCGDRANRTFGNGVCRADRNGYDSDCDGASNDVGASENDCAGAISRAPFKKLCGISVERHGGAICVGIGINVFRPVTRKGASDDVALYTDRAPKNEPTYIEDLLPAEKTVSIRAVEEKLLEELSSVYDVWSDSLLSELRDEYMEHFALAGFKARIDESSDVPIKCEVVGIDFQGNLEVIPLGSQDIVKIAAGTVRPL